MRRTSSVARSQRECELCHETTGIILTYLERNLSAEGEIWMRWLAHEKCAGTDAPIAIKPAARQRRTVWRSKNRSK